MTDPAPPPGLRQDARRMLTLAGPVVVARLGIMTMALVDTAVVGHVVPGELAFVALGSAVLSVSLVAGIGLLGGTSVMAARFKGMGQWGWIGAVWHRALGLGLLMGLVALPQGLFAREILTVLGQEPAMIAGTAPVMAALMIGIPFHLIWVAHTFFLEGLSRPLPGMVAMIIANVLNLALNLALVGGIGPIPGMGAVGSALATSASRIALSVGLGLYIWRLDEAEALHLHRFNRDDGARKAGREQLQIGLASMTSLTLEQIAFAGMSVIAGWLSVMAVAAYAIAINLLAVVFMIALGLGLAASVMVSEAYGQKRLLAVRRLGILGLGLNGLAMCTAGVLMAVTPGLLARIFTSDPDLLAVVEPMIRLGALAIVFDGTQTVASQILRGRGETWIPTASHFLSYLAVMVPGAYILAIAWARGPSALMEAVVIASILSGSLLVLRFAQVSWRDHKRGIDLRS